MKYSASLRSSYSFSAFHRSLIPGKSLAGGFKFGSRRYALIVQYLVSVSYHVFATMYLNLISGNYFPKCNRDSLLVVCKYSADLVRAVRLQSEQNLGDETGLDLYHHNLVEIVLQRWPRSREDRQYIHYTIAESAHLIIEQGNYPALNTLSYGT